MRGLSKGENYVMTKAMFPPRYFEEGTDEHVAVADSLVARGLLFWEEMPDFFQARTTVMGRMLYTALCSTSAQPTEKT